MLRTRLRRTWLHPRYVGAVDARRVLRQIRSRLSGTVLDLGCGSRQYDDVIADVASRYVGIDWPADGKVVTADILADATRLPIASNSADAVIALELIEHLPTPSALLNEICRVLKPGGLCVLSAPFLEPIHEAPRDFYRFTPFSLESLAKTAGLNVLSIERKGGWWSVVLGSFVSQPIYDFANPPRPSGERGATLFGMVVLPIITALQLIARGLDRLSPGNRFTLGWIVLAERPGP